MISTIQHLNIIKEYDQKNYKLINYADYLTILSKYIVIGIKRSIYALFLFRIIVCYDYINRIKPNSIFI